MYVKGKLYISAENGVDIWGGGNCNIDAPSLNYNRSSASKKTTR
jgi:hypothetical protein